MSVKTIRMSAVGAAIAGVLGMGAVATAAAGGSVVKPQFAIPAKRAMAMLAANPGMAKASSRDGFVLRGAQVDGDGGEHVRFERSYAGLPVIGGDIVVHSRRGLLRNVSLSLKRTLDLSVKPVVTEDAAMLVAGIRFGADFAGVPKRQLVVYARGSGKARLAWQVGMRNDRRDMTYIVDARNGAVIDSWSNNQSAQAHGVGRSLYAGDVALVTNSVTGGYELRDPSRGGGRIIDGSNRRTSGKVFKDADNTWGNYSTSDWATAAVDAHYGVSMTWDYYKNKFGRLGIADNGKGAYSRVHYGRRYANAYWNDGCFCMTYGDGDGVSIGPLVSLDITGHEMSHGVTSRTAGLIYSGESGGLNEATSDIFGTMVEFYANNSREIPNYMIGESIVIGNVPGNANQVALRFMFNPNADGRSPNCYSSSIGQLDVHYSSGVANLFFYLLAEGTGAKTYSGVNHTPARCNGANFAGIGRDKAGAIWYRALTRYFTSDTGYAAARVATLQAAKDLYGSGSNEANTVAAAWSAVAVN